MLSAKGVQAERRVQSIWEILGMVIPHAQWLGLARWMVLFSISIFQAKWGHHATRMRFGSNGWFGCIGHPPAYSRMQRAVSCHKPGPLLQQAVAARPGWRLAASVATGSRRRRSAFDPASRALLFLQPGPHAARAFTVFRTSPAMDVPPPRPAAVPMLRLITPLALRTHVPEPR